MYGNRRTRREKGAVIVLFALATTTIIGAAGLSFDIGRMYMVRNESQVYADAGALAAVVELNGTADGFTTGRNAALGVYPSGTGTKWKRNNFGSTNYDNADILVEFGPTPDGPFTASPSGALYQFQYARVTATTTTPVFLAKILTGRNVASISARAVAGQVPNENFQQGLWPFGFFSRCSKALSAEQCVLTNFGMQQNEWYTFAWGGEAGIRLEDAFNLYAKGIAGPAISDAILGQIGAKLRDESSKNKGDAFCPGDTTVDFFKSLIEWFPEYFQPNAAAGGAFTELDKLLTDRGFYYKTRIGTKTIKEAVLEGYQSDPWQVDDIGQFSNYLTGMRTALRDAILALIRSDTNLNLDTNGIPPSYPTIRFASGSVLNYDLTPKGNGARMIEAPIFQMSGAGPPIGGSPSTLNVARLLGVRGFLLLVDNQCNGPGKNPQCAAEFYGDNPVPKSNYCASYYGSMLLPIESKPPASGGVYTVRLVR